MRKNSKKSLELLNFEGPVLLAVKDSDGIKILDQWKKEVAHLTVEELIQFMNGGITITDSEGKTWNYTKEHEGAKSSDADIQRFLSTDGIEPIKEQVRISFSSDDKDYDFESVLNTQSGYEFVSCEKIENLTNPNWPKWSIIVNYKRNL